MRRPLYKTIRLTYHAFAVAIGLMAISIVCPRVASASSSTVNFQGKLVNPDGTNVTDGSYSIRFRLYTDQSADSAGPCDPLTTTCRWEETQTVGLADGNFQVRLGALTPLVGAVDFTTQDLYLGIKISSDAEMNPRVEFSSSPYAFNASALDGLASNNFVQLANGVQTDASSTPTIALNKTGTGAIIDLQANGNSVFSISASGDLRSGNSSGGTVLFSTNTVTNQVKIGDDTANSSAESTLFVVDSATSQNTPIGSNGGMFYDSTTHALRCYADDFWSDCTTTRYLGGASLSASSSVLSVVLAKPVTDLHCRLSVTGRTAVSYPLMRFNNVSTSTYAWNANGIVGTATTDWQDSNDTEIQLSGTQTAASSTLYSADINITNYSGYSAVVNWSASGLEALNTNSNHFDGVGGWYNTAQITSIQFYLSAGASYTAGSSVWCEGR